MVLVLPVVFALPVAAQQGEAEPSRGTLDERQQDRRTRVDPKYDASQIEAITTRCLSAQENLSTYSERLNQTLEGRSAIYADVLDLLTNITGQLNSEGIDTEILNIAQIEVETRINEFTGKANLLKLAVEDSIGIDCQNDPQGFKYALEDARLQFAETKAASQEITTYFRESYKPTFEVVKNGADD